MGRLLAPLLWILSLVYGGIVRLRNLYYDFFYKAPRFNLVIVSIGNLGVGGTGKTPLCLKLAEKAIQAGRKVCVVLRGYGSKEGVSDEAELYKQVLGKAHVYINPNRNAALSEIESKGYDLAFLDDAFQHRKAHRDLDILVMDSQKPVHQDAMMPFGLLREPLVGVKRASALVVTRAESLVPSVERQLEARVLNRFSPLRAFKASTKARGLRPLFEGDEWCDLNRVFLFSGIGDPSKFRGTAKSMDLKVVGEKVFADHHFVTESEALAMVEEAKGLGANALVTTAKDAVKIDAPMALPVYVLEIELEVDPGLFDLLLNTEKRVS